MIHFRTIDSSLGQSSIVKFDFKNNETCDNSGCQISHKNKKCEERISRERNCFSERQPAKCQELNPLGLARDEDKGHLNPWMRLNRDGQRSDINPDESYSNGLVVPQK